MKQKVCKNRECKKKFTPCRQMQTTCDFLCAIAYTNQRAEKKAKAEKKVHRIEKIAFNNQDVRKRTNDLKKVVQEYARLRDINEPCISCRKPTAKQWDGGHYMNAKDNAAIRFNLWNIHKQCSWCNDINSSNAINYRPNLIEKIGLEKVEWLESQTQVCRYSADYLNRFIKIYRKRVRILKKRIVDKCN